MHLRCCLGLLAVAFGLPSARAADKADPAGLEHFEKKIRPLLVENCYQCHGDKKQKGGLRLDSRSAVRKGGDTGSVIVPGAPEKSLLIKAVCYKDELRMPPRSKLPDAAIDDLTRWVALGAPMPDDSGAATALKPFDLQERRKHWAWQPLRVVAPPAVKQRDWVRAPLDAFVLAGLEAKGLVPAPPADKRTWLRRVTFDLTGLPPTPEEIAAFLRDESPAAYEKVADRLLAAPAYGERWARHWLDLVRYAETCGHEFDFDLPEAFEYRDYVIRALNADVPYDQFVREHVAGDLLPEPRRHPQEQFNESILGTGFWFLGEAKHSPVDVRGDAADRSDNQIDVFSKAFLGLTVSCARCHDHKFDAIAQKDYYALAGYLRSSRFQRAFLDHPDRARPALDALRRAQAELRRRCIETTAATLEKQLDLLPTVLLAARAAEQADQKKQPRPELPPGVSAEAIERWLQARRQLAPRLQEPVFALWAALARSEQDDRDFAARRQKLRDSLRAEEQARQQAAGKMEVFADFRRHDFRDWFVTGDAFGERPASAADVTVRDHAALPVAKLDAGSAHSGLTSRRLQGALRSPTFTIATKKIHYRVAGHGAKLNLIIDNFQQIRDPIYGGLTMGLGQDALSWRTMDVSMWKGHRAYIEVLDDGDGWAALERVVFSDGGPPADGPNPLLVRLLDAGDSASDFAQAYRKLLLEVVRQWRDGKLADAQDAPERARLLGDLLACPLLAALPVPDVKEPVKVGEALKRLEELEAKLPRPRRALALADGSGENERVFIRGSHNNLGEEAPRQLLWAIAGNAQPAPVRGSGRLELANRLVGAGNPLLPRVLVNRLWEHHFGEGIVRSVDDFGVQGQPPTHPELLDWLAADFMRQGWSMKKMHRMMILSSTYRMASRSDAKADETDPENKLLHRMPVRRLEAEALRDAMLAVSGRLDRTMYGPSVLPHLTPFMAGRGRPGVSGPLDGAGRRSVYLAVRRNFLNPMFLAFDYPVPFTTIGRRSVSNVPAQALTLLNNPFVLEQAKLWAQRVLADKDHTADDRIGRLYESAFGRPPTDKELADALAFLAEHDQGKESLAAWTDLCHVLFNVKEFVFVP